MNDYTFEDEEEGQWASFGLFIFHGVLGLFAAVPYLFYIFFTFRYKSLFQPKNVFKSNFAFSAILHLVSTIIHSVNHYWLTPLSSTHSSNHRIFHPPIRVDAYHWNQTCLLSKYNSFDHELKTIEQMTTHHSLSPSSSLAALEESSTFATFFITNNRNALMETNMCPEMIPMWWSAAAIILATFLIEYDRFLAIRYPLLYPEMVSDERSVFACIASQIGCLSLVLSVRHISPEAFVCEQMVGDVVFQRPTFFKWIVVPYFLWALLSLICSLYVTKIALHQVKKASQVHPLINLAQKPPLKTTESSSSILIDVENGDDENGNNAAKSSVGDQTNNRAYEDKSSTTISINATSMTRNEKREFENRLPMISMMGCPSPCIAPSKISPMLGYLSPSVPTDSSKQRLSPYRFRKFSPKDPVCVMIESTSNLMRASANNGNICCSPDGKFEGNSELVQKSSQPSETELNTESCFSVARTDGNPIIKASYNSSNLNQKNDNMRQFKTIQWTIVPDAWNVNKSDNDHQDDEKMNHNRNNMNIIRSSSKAISYKCRQLRNVSRLKRMFPSNAPNALERLSPTHGGRKDMKHRQMRKIRQSGRKVKCHPRIFTKNLRSRVLPFTKGALETKEDDEDLENNSNTKRYSTNEEEMSKDETRCEVTNTLTTHIVPALDYKIQENSIGDQRMNSLRTDKELKSESKDDVRSDEHISNPSDICKSINDFSHIASPNSLNPLPNGLMINEEERSMSAPIDGGKIERERDRLSSAAFFSTANIHQQWNTFNQLEKLKALLKNTPNYFEENEKNADKAGLSNSERGQSESYGRAYENCKNPFALLAQSLDGPQDLKEGNVSINELVVKEYATEQEEMGNNGEAHQSNSMKVHNAIQSQIKKDIIGVGQPFFKSLVGMQLAKSSAGGELDRVDKKTGKISSSLEDLKNDFRSTIKTLALILMYLLISLPTYIAAAVHRNCYCAAPNGLQNCQKLREYMYVFDNVSLIGHIIFPCTWLLLDKMYSDKLLKTLRLVRDAR